MASFRFFAVRSFNQAGVLSCYCVFVLISIQSHQSLSRLLNPLLTGPSATREKWSGHVSPNAEGKRGKRSRALVGAGVEGGGGVGVGGMWGRGLVFSPERYFRFKNQLVLLLHLVREIC